MKTRFSSIDIRTTVSNLQKTLLGLRLANVYDLSPRVFLFKFSKPDCKKTLIIESGIRIHSTNFIRDKRDNTPAPFSLTLRKYLKTKRLESVNQLGVDRVVQFTFGSGVAIQHLFVELYSIGNIILTDGEFKILAILRTHQYNQDEAVAVGDVYPADKAKKPINFTDELVDDIIKSASDKKESLKQLFNKQLDFGPELVEHCLLTAGLSPQTKIEQYDHSKFGSALSKSFKDAQSIYNVTVQSRGYIVLKDKKPEKQQQQKQQQQKKLEEINGQEEEKKPQEELVIYEEFVPYLYKQYQEKKYLEFDNFDLAVDQFFSEIESQKIEQQRIAQEQNVLKKLDKVKEEHQKRIDSLLNQEELNIRKASLIELNLQEVDQCIQFIRYGVNAGMDWTMLSQMVKEEKKKNPYSVVNKIQKLKLESSKIQLLLSDSHAFDDDYDNDNDEQDEEEEQQQNNNNKKQQQKKKKDESLVIDVDINISALANAKTYYDTKKKSFQKAQKTIAQTENALKAAEKKTRQQLQEVNLKSKSSMIQQRKIFWFEKFHWFISSDNYLVISGKDAQQNELLFKRYLEKDDIYLHADIFGSTTCIIKNHVGGGEIPPNTLTQAGTSTMCYSNAWSSKVVTSAYWVYAHQVSKTAPSGEYLTTGSFMIRGKKNYLPHSQLVMGFGFMFKIDESCIGNHINDRKPSQFALGADDDQDDQFDQNQDQEKGEKNLRKFERTKLKKEQKELDDLEKQIESLNLPKDIKSSSDMNTTITTPTPSKEQQQQQQQDKFRVKLVTSYQDDLEDEKNESEQQKQEKTKAHLSAHQRKLLKKQKDQSSDINNEQQQQQADEQKVVEEVKVEKSTEKKPKNEPQKQLLPSQKNKLKKIKEKYGDQDEEERKERMELLGSAGNKENNNKKNKKDKKKNNNNNKGNKPQQQQKDNKNKPTTTTTATPNAPETTTTTTTTTTPIPPKEIIEEKVIIEDDSDSDSGDDIDDEDENDIKEGEGDDNKTPEEREAIQQKRRQMRKEKKEAKLKEQEEIKKILEEENSSKLVDPKDVSTNIDTLTGQPLENDILHFAVPVIAPYSVFNNYKFKVKLTPGHQKRGKAAKQAMQVLIQLQNITKIEKDLIKNIKDEDLATNMLSDVRIHAPNLLATKLQEKKDKKAKAIAKNKELTESKEQ